jgi:hypothetical protein
MDGFSKDDFKGSSDYVNGISKNFYICMDSSCEKKHILTLIFSSGY